DALRAARTIYAQPALQATLTAAADKQIQDAPTNAASNALTNAIDSFADSAKALTATAPIGWPPGRFHWGLLSPLNWHSWFGWPLTAVAAMLGGPFWFGILQTLVNARNAGPKPNSSTSGAS